MGALIDSSVLIAGERGQLDLEALLAGMRKKISLSQRSPRQSYSTVCTGQGRRRNATAGKRLWRVCWLGFP